MQYQAVLFDFIGTTVREKDPDTIMTCFKDAFHDHQVTFDATLLRTHRGKDKLIMITIILDNQKLPRSLAPGIYTSFKENVANSIGNFCEAEGAIEIFQFLIKRHTKIGIGTGMERDLFDRIFAGLGWDKSWFDYIGIAGEVGRSRPHADMIWDMMRCLDIQSTASVLKVGDTVADIQEGKNTGSPTVAVASGTQSIELLKSAKPDFVINSLAELQRILLNDAHSHEM